MTRVLLVDDSRAALSMIKKNFDPLSGQVAQFEVVTCTDVDAALGLLRSSTFDCIVSDYEMQGKTGFEFASIIKNDPTLRYVPFIIMTSKEPGQFLKQAIDAGADDFINKSSPPEVFNAKIHSMLRLAAARKEVETLRRTEGISAIVASYNHEFNNALAIILGFWPKIEAGMPPEQLVYAKKVENQVHRIHEIVKKISEAKRLHLTDYSDKSKMVKVS